MSAAPAEIVRWALLAPPGQLPIVVLVIDDSTDDQVTSALAEENVVPSERFGGLWGSGERNGNWLVAFVLIEHGDGLERQWFTDNIHRELLEAVLEVPHLVALLPSGARRRLQDRRRAHPTGGIIGAQRDPLSCDLGAPSERR